MSIAPSTAHVRPLAPLRNFMRTEAAGGALLLVATVIALVWANSPWKAAYSATWDTEFALTLGRYSFEMNLHHWINDGLMTIFFFVVGMEIKREATSGHLASRQQLMLPLMSAIGGMVIPALLYLAVAGGVAPRGWGVPMATDIALAVGLLSVMAKRVPTSGRVFLLGLAVVDDIGAIIVIALFYSSGVSGWVLVVAIGAVLSVVVFQRLNVQYVPVYIVAGVLAWFALYQAGVHPTLAGVATGLLTPLTPLNFTSFVRAEESVTGELAPTEQKVTVLEWFEHHLAPWSSFFIVPVFALSNAGVEISTSSISDAVSSRVAWGIIVGLFIGKPIGVILATRIAMRAGIARMPSGCGGLTLWGVGHAAGVGFTVALFISELAFTNEQHQADAKMAILFASFISAIVAIVVLARSPEATPEEASPIPAH
jgi:NhaA family Na+:H+ antiporter